MNLPPPSPPRRKSAVSIDVEAPDFDSRATVQAPLKSVRPMAVTVPPAASGASPRLVAGLAAVTMLVAAGGITWWAVGNSADQDEAVASETEEAKLPSKRQVADLIDDVQSADDATKYLADGDRDELTHLVDELRALSVGEPALAGLWAASFAGDGFVSIPTCQRSSDHLAAVWNATADTERSCDEVDATLAKNLVAATLRHDDLDVVSVKRTKNPDTFVAKVQADDDEPFKIRLRRESGKLRLELFDDDGKLHAKPAGDADAVVGKWAVTHPRKASSRLKKVDEQTTEEITITRDGERIKVRHRVLNTYYGKPGARFRCNESEEVEVGWARELVGSSANGGVLAKATGETQRIGRDAEKCTWRFNGATAGYYRVTGGELSAQVATGTDAPEKVTLRSAE